MELQYWQQADLPSHRAKLSLYLWAFGFYRNPASVLEIGCGPLGGVLPLITRAQRRVAVDPLCEAYREAGMLPLDSGIEFISEHFEEWKSSEKFDAIFAADALDHGEMGFFLMPRFAEMLTPGGRLYVHVNMRPAERLNALHDHPLTIGNLDAALAHSKLVELRRDIYPNDVDGAYECPSLVGVWERPA